ncbi:unnamed protein product [Lepidochelys kempii]
MLLFVVFLVLYVLNLVGNLAIIIFITWAGYVAQRYISLSLAGTECILLAVMANDCYVAICHLLHYTIVIGCRLSLQMAATIWLNSFGNSILQTSLTVWLPRCGQNWLDHFIREVPVLLKLACVDTSDNEAQAFAVSVIFQMALLGLTLVSYSYKGTINKLPGRKNLNGIV